MNMENKSLRLRPQHEPKRSCRGDRVFSTSKRGTYSYIDMYMNMVRLLKHTRIKYQTAA